MISKSTPIWRTALREYKSNRGTVTNLCDQRRHRLDCAHLPSGISGVETPDRGFDHEIIQWFGMIDQRANRLITSLDTQIARVEIVVGHSNDACVEKAESKPNA